MTSTADRPPLTYLDTGVWFRPFDDMRIARNAHEAQAFAEILEVAERGGLTLCYSRALRHEVRRTPDQALRHAVARFFQVCRRRAQLDQQSANLAQLLRRELDLTFWDTVHLALGAATGAAYFVTTDDRLLRRARDIENILQRAVQARMRILGPQELLEEIRGDNERASD
ncbi:MAG: hypothetical protein HY332_00205 [Chloroflexi bacterium]|nr:hypothetical protein [Chloroflexota bacterium]